MKLALLIIYMLGLILITGNNVWAQGAIMPQAGIINIPQINNLQEQKITGINLTEFFKFNYYQMWILNGLTDISLESIDSQRLNLIITEANNIAMPSELIDWELGLPVIEPISVAIEREAGLLFKYVDRYL